MNVRAATATLIVILSATDFVVAHARSGHAEVASNVVPVGYARAFSENELAAEPTANWITNGGSLANQRFSPLTEINASNVARLRSVWRIHLGGAGIAARYSAESQPLEYRGVIYVSTGIDDVFAVSADDGKILWEHRAHLGKLSTICCGWINRGVALGDGKVYIGQLDGKLVALDQMSGNVVWSTPLEPWQSGYTITSAPLYVDGMVITGLAGGAYGIRGRVTAFDAETGKEVWRFYTIPGPGQTGYESWPQTGNVWLRGGAPVLQTPSADPRLGLLYFSTGNAGPDNDGSKRAGKNLFAASIVAVDLKTGRLRWYYQMVHHDIWDYDAPAATVLFNAMIDGRPVRGIGEPEKTGWLYLLDRTNGKPIFPIPERPVPQDARQKTWPTQPIPGTTEFVPHRLPNAQAYFKEMTIIPPGSVGGTNGPPSTYNPNTHTLYGCAQIGVDKDTGIFSAFDVTTGKMVWQKVWPGDSCYSGPAATAGNLVFVGRNRAELQAYNAGNGELLWTFQTGAGANGMPTIFRRNGHEYLTYYAGGNALAATPHGDYLWLFGLDGKLGPGRPLAPARDKA